MGNSCSCNNGNDYRETLIAGSENENNIPITNKNQNVVISNLKTNENVVDTPKEKQEQTGSKESLKFSALIQKDDDLKSKVENIEICLYSKEAPFEEKLRTTLMTLKDLTEAETDVSEEEFIEKFFGLIERYYNKLYGEFVKIMMGHKPLIKLLQIFDLMLENFTNSDTRIKLIERFYVYLQAERAINIDWRYLRKSCQQWKDLNSKDLPSSEVELLISGFLKRIEVIKNALLWKRKSESIKLIEEIFDGILSLHSNNPKAFLLCLLKGRFDKKDIEIKGSCFSMIIGDEGGLFLLFNRVIPESREEKIIMGSGVSKNFLEEKRGIDQKVILGKGSFGKVSFAMSVFGDLNIDIGQLVCVKKSFRIGVEKNIKAKTNTLKNISDSTIEDFFAKTLNESVHTPKPLDMAILNSNLIEESHRKGYLFMEVVPENTADTIFAEKKYQKWEFQKPYIVDIMKTTQFLLKNNGLFNSDLKPPNTLFDPLSRKIAIIDLGSSLLIEKGLNLESFDLSQSVYGVTYPYCPPELCDDNNFNEVNLIKAVSYLCGVTIAEITCKIPTDKTMKKNIKNWELVAEYTDLPKDDKDKFIEVLRGLTEEDPGKRLLLDEAIKKVESLGDNEFLKKAISEQYIEKLRKFIKEDPTLLNLNDDINEIKEKGFITQMTVENNPAIYKKQTTKNLSEELEELVSIKEESKNLIILLGDAGSGKSLALQLKFINEVDDWIFGKPIPLFFNLANEYDLDNVIRNINANLGCNLKLEVPNDEIHLYIDSYDEGPANKAHQKVGHVIESKSIISQYFEKLEKWKICKIVISCRTEFVQREADDDDFSDFKVNDIYLTSMRVRYIAPIGYINEGEDTGKSNIDFEITEWFKREGIKEDAQKIEAMIKRLSLEPRMNTGLLFNMVIKMLLSMSVEDNNLDDLRLKEFEIYRRTIREEFKSNSGKVFFSLAAENQMADYIKNLTAISIINDESQFSDDKELIWEGLERLGEILAAEMMVKKSNRINFTDIENLFDDSKYNENDTDYICNIKDNERIEWKTLYQIFRVMGLKLEKRRLGKKEGKNKQNISINKEVTYEIGFRHETYKNYYLLRGLKRLLIPSMRALDNKNSKETKNNISDNVNPGSTSKLFQEKFESKIINALLEQEGIFTNYALMRFCGEEIQNYKDSNLSEALRKLLNLEQQKSRVKHNGKKDKEENCEETDLNTKKSAVIVSLLVAGNYSFTGQDLSFLDLSEANMRGGIFCDCMFEKTNFSKANFRHINISGSIFQNANLSGIHLGVWPDLIGHNDWIDSVSLSYDGKRIVSGSRDKLVKIWDSQSGNCLKTLNGHSGHVKSVCFSPDGERIVSGSDDKTIKIWKYASGECIQTIKGHSNKIKSVCFSPDGKRIASGGFDKLVKIWDSMTGDLLKTLEGHSGQVTSVCFSPDGKRITSGSFDRSVRIWDSASGICLQTLVGHSENVNSVSFSPDGKSIVSGSLDYSLKIWESASGKCIKTLTGHSNQVLAGSFSPDGKKIVSGSEDRSVKIWDFASGQCVHTLMGHCGDVSSVCFSPDGKKIASSSEDARVKFWDSVNGECVQENEGHSFHVKSICFSPDGKRIASGSRDESVKIWNSTSGECLKTLKGNFECVNSVCFSPDGNRIASGSDDKSVRIWDTESGNCLHILNGHQQSVNSVCFSPDGDRLASASDDKSVKIWSSFKGECLKSIGYSSLVNSVCFSPDGKKLVSGGMDNTVKILDTISGKCLNTLNGHSKFVLTACFSPDGGRIASGSEDETVRIWDSASGKCLKTLKGHFDIVSTVCFSPNGMRIASGSGDSLVKIWDCASGECLNTLSGHIDGVNSTCFSPDGKRLASGSEDHSVKIWDSYSSEEYIVETKQVQQPLEKELNGGNEGIKCNYRLSKSLRGAEETFVCKGANFIKCIFEDGEQQDIRNKIIIGQRRGLITAD